MQKIVEWKLNIVTKTESNYYNRWSKSSRKRDQREAVLRSYLRDQPKFSLPCHVNLIRISPRLMDPDNLVSSFKYIKDAVAVLIRPEAQIIVRPRGRKFYINPGHADNTDLIKWDYNQEKGRVGEYAVKIEIFQGEE